MRLVLSPGFGIPPNKQLLQIWSCSGGLGARYSGALFEVCVVGACRAGSVPRPTTGYNKDGPAREAWRPTRACIEEILCGYFLSGVFVSSVKSFYNNEGHDRVARGSTQTLWEINLCD